jgi:hypothetical protein
VTRVVARRAAASSSDLPPAWPSAAARPSVPGFDVLGDGAGMSAASPALATFLSLAPGAPRPFLTADLSCATGDLALTLPRAGALSGNASAPAALSAAAAAALPASALTAPLALELSTSAPAAEITLDWEGVPSSDRPRLRRLDATSNAGPISLAATRLGVKGARLLTVSGDIALRNVDARCDALDLGGDALRGGITAETTRGAITLDGGAFLDCDVTLRGDAASVRVTGGASFRASPGSGSALLAIRATTGLVALEDARVQRAELRGDAGAVRARNVTVEVNGALRATTRGAPVALTALALLDRASVQVDTDTGAVRLEAARFAGVLAVVTGGTVSCAGKGFGAAATAGGADPCAVAAAAAAVAGRAPLAADGTPLSVVEGLPINCAGSACAYLGTVVITSALGDVALTFA